MKVMIFLLFLAFVIYTCDGIPKTSTKKSSKKTPPASAAELINKSLIKTLDKNNKTLTKFIASTNKSATTYINKIALDTVEAQTDISAQIQSILNGTKAVYGTSQDAALMNNIDVSSCSAPVAKVYEKAKTLEDAAAACLAERIANSQKLGAEITTKMNEILKSSQDMRASTAECSAGFIGEVDQANSEACLKKINSKALYESFGTLPAAKLHLEAELTKLKIEKAEIMLCNDLPTYQLFEDESLAAAQEVKTCMDLKINPPTPAPVPTPEAVPATAAPPKETAPANADSKPAAEIKEPVPAVSQEPAVPTATK